MRPFPAVSTPALQALCFATLLACGCATAPRPSGSSSASSSAPPPQDASMAPAPPPPAAPRATAPSNSAAIPRPAPTRAAAPPPPVLHEKRAPSRSPASAADAVAPTTSAAPAPPATDEYALGDQMEAWKNKLKSGAVEYYVPPAMTAMIPSTVTVDVHGYQDAQTHSLPQATGTDAVKVSSRMKVELLAPQNPGEFTITPQSGDAIQFIPNDGHATWAWNVTPANADKNQQLQIRVSLVYKGASGNIEQILEEKSYAVNVDVQALSVTIRQSFWKDPLGWFKYMLPGGAGWAAIAALVSSLGGLTWWQKKKISRKKKPAAATITEP